MTRLRGVLVVPLRRDGVLLNYCEFEMSSKSDSVSLLAASLPAGQLADLLATANHVFGLLEPGGRKALCEAVVARLVPLLDLRRCRLFMAGNDTPGRLVLEAAWPRAGDPATQPPNEPLIESIADTDLLRLPWQEGLVVLSGENAEAQTILEGLKKARFVAGDCQSAMLWRWQSPAGQCLAFATAEKGGSEGETTIGQDATHLGRLLGTTVGVALDKIERLGALNNRLTRQSAELDLAHAELDRAVKLRDQFLANMSHELRTPLNVIIGMTQALQEEVAGPLNQEQLDLVQMVEKSGRNLLGMLSDIINLAKIGAHKYELNPGPVIVEAICRDCLQIIVQSARQKKLNVDLKCAPKVSEIEVDESLLKEILVNLLINAVKFTPAGGTIGLQFEALPGQGLVEFIVWDTGPGMAKADLEGLFHPQPPAADKQGEPEARARLGLHLVQRFTELHGGSVAVQTELGKGSRFLVTLPWTQAGETAPVLPPEGLAWPASQGPVLLLVQNQISRTAIESALEACGIPFHLTRETAEMMREFHSRKPGAIVIDLQCLGMDGVNIIRYLRNDRRFAPVPIVLLNSLIVPGLPERHLAAGASACLRLPANGGELVACLSDCLRKKPILDNAAPQGPHGGTSN